MTRAEVYGQTLRFFFAPVADLLYDPAHDDVSEVMINGPDDIFFERDGKIERAVGRRFADGEALMAAVRNLAEYVDRRIGDDIPAMDARLPEPEKFRVHVIVPPCARGGACVTLRKFRRNNTTLAWLLQKGSITAAAAEYLTLAVRRKLNLIVSGGTGSGKTSLLNALSAAIPDEERVVVIEDSSELRLLSEVDPPAGRDRGDKPHAVYLETRPPRPDGTGAVTIRDLFVNSLRMRPDRILVGEVRRGEALDMVQSMLSGHDGELSTVHASSPRLALVRLETLSLMNELGLPVYVARTQVGHAIHVIVQVNRYPDGSRKIDEIAEVGGLDAKERYRVRSLFRFVQTGRDGTGRILGQLQPTGAVSRFSRRVLESSAPHEVLHTKEIWRLRENDPLPTMTGELARPS